MELNLQHHVATSLNVPSSAILVTDSNELYQTAVHLPVPVIYIPDAMVHDEDIGKLSFSLMQARTVVMAVQNNDIKSNVLLPLCYSYIVDLETNYLQYVIQQEGISVQDVLKEVVSYVMRDDISFSRVDITSLHTNHSRMPLLTNMTNQIFAVFGANMEHMLPTYKEDIQIWHSVYEPMLREKYKVDKSFKSIIDDINYKRFIIAPECILIRPIMIYVFWLLHQLGHIVSIENMTIKSVEFAYHIAYYMYHQKGMRDNIA